MTDDEAETENEAVADGASVAHIVEGPPGLGAWLSQSQDEHSGYSRLEWNESCGSRKQYQLHESVPPKKIFNATVQEDVRDGRAPKFSLHKLYTGTDFIETRDFDAHVPHQDLLQVVLDDAQEQEERRIFPGSALCAEVGVLPIGEHAVTRFYTVGTVTGRRANDFSLLLPQDAITTSKRWSSAPIREKDTVVISYPTQILDVKVRTTSLGNYFGIRTASTFTILPFLKEVDARGSGDIRHFYWREPLHLSTACFHGHAIADFAFNPFAMTVNEHLAIMVDETGGLWWTRQEAEEAADLPFVSCYSVVEQLRRGCETDGRSRFSRITYGKDMNVAVVARDDAIRVYNLEDHKLDYTLFSLSDSKTRILDMAQPSRSYPNSPHRVICTRTEIIWLDIERPGAPVLRLKHYHDDDDTLALHSAFCDGLCHTFLWSRKTPALSIYTTPAAGPMQLVLTVYNIPSPVPNMQRSGLASIHVPSRRWKKYSAPESLVLIESAADGSVYQRELVTHKMPVIPRELENGRVEHRRIGADQPLTHLPLEDPKRFKVAHFFMLYNRLFGTIPSLHKDQADPSSLIYSPRDADDEAMHIPLEVFKAEQSHKSDDTIKEVTSFFSSGQAIDASAVSPQALTLELGRLNLSEKAASMFQISDKLLGVPTNSGNDAPSISKALQALYACDRFTRSPRTGENDDNEEAAVQTAHRFACDEVAVDLILSKAVLAMEVPTAPSAEEAEDVAMTAYDRLADLPDIEYGFFRPIDANGNPPTSDAARALLSEWTLGADPHIRPAFKNPYSQQARDEKTANTQLKAFKSRLAQGAGMSASQPLPGPSHLRRPAGTQVPKLARLTESLQEPDVEHTPTRERPPIAQSQTVTTEAEPETPMPFTQMMPGVHGGRPAKKKKKRTGGF